MTTVLPQFGHSSSGNTFYFRTYPAGLFPRKRVGGGIPDGPSIQSDRVICSLDDSGWYDDVDTSCQIGLPGHSNEV